MKNRTIRFPRVLASGDPDVPIVSVGVRLENGITYITIYSNLGIHSSADAEGAKMLAEAALTPEQAGFIRRQMAGKA